MYLEGFQEALPVEYNYRPPLNLESAPFFGDDAIPDLGEDIVEGSYWPHKHALGGVEPWAARDPFGENEEDR